MLGRKYCKIPYTEHRNINGLARFCGDPVKCCKTAKGSNAGSNMSYKSDNKARAGGIIPILR